VIHYYQESKKASIKKAKKEALVSSSADGNGSEGGLGAQDAVVRISTVLGQDLLLFSLLIPLPPPQRKEKLKLNAKQKRPISRCACHTFPRHLVVDFCVMMMMLMMMLSALSIKLVLAILSRNKLSQHFPPVTHPASSSCVERGGQGK
jgi:hypothetical protein